LSAAFELDAKSGNTYLPNESYSYLKRYYPLLFDPRLDLHWRYGLRFRVALHNAALIVAF